MYRNSTHMARVREVVYSCEQQRMLQTDAPRTEHTWVIFLASQVLHCWSEMNDCALANLRGPQAPVNADLPLLFCSHLN